MTSVMVDSLIIVPSITNRSSERQGYALALDWGAQVILIHTATGLPYRNIYRKKLPKDNSLSSAVVCE